MTAKQIWANQEKNQKQLQSLRNRLFLILYDSALKTENVRKIHKKLLDETINSQKLFAKEGREPEKPGKTAKIKELEGADLLILCLLLAKKVARGQDAVNLLWKNYEASEKAINKNIRDDEDSDKKQYLKDLSSVFYVASAHGDSATDHAPHQGKVYIDENWRSKTDNKEVAKYILKNHIKTMQWVTGAPVYFITRPNCRHYFVEYSVDDILSGNYTIPYHAIGPRDNQTPRGKRLKYYEQRLRMLKVLSNRYKTDDLTRKILKTDIIIKKYKKNLLIRIKT